MQRLENRPAPTATPTATRSNSPGLADRAGLKIDTQITFTQVKLAWKGHLTVWIMRELA